jgi:hypothetical protein
LLANLTYNSAPQVEIFVLIITEVRPSPPFDIIMSGEKLQFEFYAVFRERLAKIADQIPGTDTTWKDLINHFVGTWKIALGVRRRKHEVASTHFIEHIGKPLRVKVLYCLAVRQRTTLLWLALARPVHHHRVLGLHHPVSGRRYAPCGLSGKFHLHLGLDNFKRDLATGEVPMERTIKVWIGAESSTVPSFTLSHSVFKQEAVNRLELMATSTEQPLPLP